jgi:hypothetical protein
MNDRAKAKYRYLSSLCVADGAPSCASTIEQQFAFWDDCTSHRTAGLSTPKMRSFRFADRNIEYLSFGYRRQINIALLSERPIAIRNLRKDC